MLNFQDTFETLKVSFINAFSICMTVPSKWNIPKNTSQRISLKNSSLGQKKILLTRWTIFFDCMNSKAESNCFITTLTLFSLKPGQLKMPSKNCKPGTYSNMHMIFPSSRMTPFTPTMFRQFFNSCKIWISKKVVKEPTIRWKKDFCWKILKVSSKY